MTDPTAEQIDEIREEHPEMFFVGEVRTRTMFMLATEEPANLHPSTVGCYTLLTAYDAKAKQNAALIAAIEAAQCQLMNNQDAEAYATLYEGLYCIPQEAQGDE